MFKSYGADMICDGQMDAQIDRQTSTGKNNVSPVSPPQGGDIIPATKVCRKYKYCKN